MKISSEVICVRMIQLSCIINKKEKIRFTGSEILYQALALKKAKNVKGATNKIKQKKRLEQAIDQINAQQDNIQTIKMSAFGLNVIVGNLRLSKLTGTAQSWRRQ